MEGYLQSQLLTMGKDDIILEGEDIGAVSSTPVYEPEQLECMNGEACMRC